MGGFERWFWNRYRTRFLAAVGGLAWVALVAFICVPVTATATVLFGGTFFQYLAWGTLASAFAALGVCVSVAWTAPTLRGIRAWGRGDTSDPPGALEAALRAPQQITLRAVLIQLPFQQLVTAPVAALVMDLGWVGFASMEIGAAIVQLAALLMFGIGLHLLFRPMLEEINEHLETGTATDTARAWSLRGRILAATWVGCTATGMASGGVAVAAESDEAALLAAAGAGAAFGLYVMAIMHAGLLNPTLRPVRDILRATRRVSRGEFGDRVPVTSADEFGDVAVAFNDMLHGLAERESLRAAFGSYVDPALAQRLLEQGDSVFDGEEVEVTVFFADVRGFTTFAETATPQESVARLNHLFGIVVPVIRDAGGHANHYLGDGVLAVFGTPNPLPDHADRAVGAAVEVQRRVHAEFGDDLRIGIGVNSGNVIAGTIGGGGKLEFTVIGDTVNVASRVEALTKETGDAILITQATLDALSARPGVLTDRGELEVRGKAQCVQLYGVDPA